ncbi:MAG: hypothetical protein WCT42_00790 [Candidatus Paceibacterota bacterium]
MKKIGQGWQYTTYDLGNGRVLKKFHSWSKAYFVMLRDIFPFNKDSSFKIPSFIKIDKFIEFNLKLLNLGVIDKGFNITKNYGIDHKGQIVLIDIGELFDDKELINKQFKNRVWTHSYVGGCIQNKEAQEYFISEMDRNFSII